MRRRGTTGHLVRRFFGSLGGHGPSSSDLAAVAGVLDEGEFGLWLRMQGRDQRHSVEVWRRFLALLPGADPDEQRAALLHDLGKCATSAGPVRRAVATMFGPLTPSLRRYLDHERLGLEMLSGISSARTLEVLGMRPDDPAGAALRAADDL